MPGPPPTRILSWQQLVLEADPSFQRDRQQPWIYSFSNARRFYAPVGLYLPLPDGGLINNASVLNLDALNGWPSSPSGLQAGQLYSAALVVKAITGRAPQPGAAPLFFGDITASELLLLGTTALPLIAPTLGSGQLWFNGDTVCVA